MKAIMALCFSILVFLGTTRLQAQIYSWTDENGVRRYSNTEPDQTAADVEIQQEVQADSGSEKPTSPDEGNSIASPPGWNEVFDEQERQKNARQQNYELEQQQAADAELKIKVQTEKERLQGEIERIQQLAVGPSLPLSLKNARIKQFQDKLDALEKSPDDYFSRQTD